MTIQKLRAPVPGGNYKWTNSQRLSESNYRQNLGGLNRVVQFFRPPRSTNPPLGGEIPVLVSPLTDKTCTETSEVYHA